jgi:serine/threonine protein kinase
MSPEILEGHAYGIGADIYSLGVLLFNLISGTFPYKAYGFT